MLLLKNGVMLLPILVLLSSCRGDNPPLIDICLGDGFGGADCLLKDGTKRFLKPSELKNAWISNQEDMSKFSAWCYDTSRDAVDGQMRVISEEVGHGSGSN